MALTTKAFSGSTAKLSKSRASRASAVRVPVVVRAQANNGEAEMVRGRILRIHCAARAPSRILTPLPPPLSQSRRATLGMLAGVAGLAATASPSYAAYGDSANVFGRVTNKSGGQSRVASRRLAPPRAQPQPVLTLPLACTAGFVPYAGEGFAMLLPSKWNPSKEKDFEAFATTQLR